MSALRCASTVLPPRPCALGWPGAVKAGKLYSEAVPLSNRPIEKTDIFMKRTRQSTLAVVMLAFFVLAARGAGGKFYSDDPIQREPETRDASNARPLDIDL